jgi:Tfp pilus assembly protein PilF
VRHEFVVWDDEANISESPYMQPVSATNTARVWREPYFAMYIPVTRTVWAGIGSVSAGPRNAEGKVTYDPLPFHAANLLVHCLNVLLVFALLRRFVKKDWAAAAGALLFAVHPLQVEPVAWVTGMKDLLGASFSLAASLAYIRYADRMHSEETRAAAWKHYALASALFGFALLAKPASAVLPIILFVLDRLLLNRTGGASIRALLPWALAALPIAWITHVAEKATGAVPQVQWWSRPVIVGDTFAWYLRKLAWPGSTSIDYGRTPATVLHNPFSYLACVGVLALLVIAWRSRRRSPMVLAGLAILLVSILPVSGVSPFAFQTISNVADRYAYLGLAGAALAIAAILARIGWRPIIPAVAACLIAAAMWSNNLAGHWATSESLLRQTVAVNPESWMAWNNLAVLRERDADVATAQRYYETALNYNPRSFMSHNNLGLILERKGDLAGAAQHFEKAVQANSQYPEAHFNLGRMLARAADPASAAKEFKRALVLNPDYTAAYNNLGAMLTHLGNPADARACFVQAVKIEPGFADAQFNLGVNYLQAGRPVQAAKHLAEAVRLKPSNSEAQRALADALAVTGRQARR